MREEEENLKGESYGRRGKVVREEGKLKEGGGKGVGRRGKSCRKEGEKLKEGGG